MLIIIGYCKLFHKDFSKRNTTVLVGCERAFAVRCRGTSHSGWPYREESVNE